MTDESREGTNLKEGDERERETKEREDYRK